MKNKKVKGFVLIISAMFFLIMFCGGAIANNDYEDFEKNYIRYTSGPPCRPREYDDMLEQSRIRLKFSADIFLD